jgi:hypothetical protein
MPLHLAGGHAEIAERARHQPAVMIAGEEERRPAACIFLNHRRNFVGVQESSRSREVLAEAGRAMLCSMLSLPISAAFKSNIKPEMQQKQHVRFADEFNWPV